MSKSLLSHIAGSFISEYENVANSSVSYLLNEYQSARVALENILGVDFVPAHYVTELSTKSNGRPDVTGLDLNGDKVVIIEGKFWANLTENQPVNYLKELTQDGKLLFLTPDKRISSLKIEVEKRINGINEKIVFCSWNSFLALVEAENNKVYNATLASDLIQFKELCQRMDVEGMAPLSESDLDPMNGKINYHFSDLIDECNAVLRGWEHGNFKKMKTSASKGEYGFYFKGLQFGCYLAFSSYNWFSKDSHTPIWLYIYEANDSGWVKSKQIFHYLNIFDSKNSYDESSYSSYGVILQSGMDKSEIVQYIADKVKEVLTSLDQNIST
ncbi:MAG: hypothetical protein R8K53_02880 [Mariprofundaceae bacterium]